MLGLEHYLGVTARFEVVMPDGIRAFAYSSPTLDLRRRVAEELFASSPTAVVTPIDRLCLADTAGSTRDCASVSSADWAGFTSDPTSHQATVTKSVTVTASYTVGYFRAYSGTVLYFESAVSPTFDVLSGQTVTLSMTLTITSSHSPSVSGGLPAVASSDSSVLRGLLLEILRGARPSGAYLTLEGVNWRAGATVLLSVPLFRSYEVGATSGSASHDYRNFTAGGNLDRVHVDCTNIADCIVYLFTSALSVSTSDRARYSVTISV